MSDDEADPELLELLRQSLSVSTKPKDEISSDTGVLRDAEYIYNNAIDVHIDMYGTKAAAANIYQSMQERRYSTHAWTQVELHPKPSEGFSQLDIVNFVFTMDLLNFSFWSELSGVERYQVDYTGKHWTGYNSLLACLRRAIDDGIPITTPTYWLSGRVSDEALKNVFRSATAEQIPLIGERISILREAADVLHKSFGDLDEPVEGATEEPTAVPVDLEPVGHVDPSDAKPEVTAQDHPDTEDPENGVTLPEAAPIHPDHVHVDPVAVPSGESQSDAHEAEIVRDAAVGEPVTESPRQGEADHQASEMSIKEQQAPPRPDYSVVRLIEKADHSAGKLVNLLVKHFPCFRDETRFDRKKVRLFKRAQILVADLWAAFGGTGYGEFHDIDNVTMFADYRVPQMLHSLGVLSYSPPLYYRIQSLQPIDSEHSWEVQLRGCSIWAVELIRREILRNNADAQLNAVLIDFFLYDLAKERERAQEGLAMPHHRTRSMWY
ncbi:hypothetical protein LTR85_004680 [Meristemomyces frigidus]|nr:hypothetical protein LTR85_004680 [Meristemomyces frigidus]